MVLFSGCVADANADDWPAPGPFEVVSNDGNMVFRFDPLEPIGDNEASAGVYRNSEPEELVYTVHGLRTWAYSSDFYFSEDFRSFVFIPSPTEDIALQFFTDGELVKTYKINDLVKNRTKITRSTSSLWWIKRMNTINDEPNNTLTLTTVDDRTYVFDITNGSILEKNRDSSGMPIWLYVIIGTLGLAVVIVLLSMLRLNLSNRREKNRE